MIEPAADSWNGPLSSAWIFCKIHYVRMRVTDQNQNPARSPPLKLPFAACCFFPILLGPSVLAAPPAAPLVEPMAVATVSPSRWLEQPIVRRFPVEILSAAMTEQFGTDPQKITDVRFAATVDPVAGPMSGFLITDPGNDPVARIAVMMGGQPDPDNASIHVLDPRIDLVLASVDADHWFFGHRPMIPTLSHVAAGQSVAADLAAAWPQDDQLRVAIDVPLVRPLLGGLIEAGERSLVGSLRPLLDLPSLTQTLQLCVAFDGKAGELQMTFAAANDADAQRVETILRDSLAAAVVLLTGQIHASMDVNGTPKFLRMPILDYSQRTSAWIIENLRVTREGSSVSLNVEGDVGVASTIAVAGYGLPMIAQAIARFQPPSRTNNLKQILLAMHNYHAAYNRLPGPGITDADGKLLLSWRVSLLPFIEEQGLWERFHKDEPWDSEHNLPLAKEMPRVYQSSADLDETMTVYHGLVGEGLAISPEGETTFRQFLDGLSNTLIVLESKPEHAVLWSKPEDMTIDLQDPFANLNEGPGGFAAAWGDGAVQVLDAIDEENFRRALTRAGFEIIDRDAHSLR